MSMKYMSVFGTVVLGLLLAGTLDAAPYQELEHREGYVPVYIREGDTPLIEINPLLAEAFNEIDTKNLLEQADDQPELETKPELILMSVDNADAMLMAQPNDQNMSDDEPMEVIAIVQAPDSESQDMSDIAEIPAENPIENEEINNDNDKAEEDESLQEETNAQQLDEAKEAIQELVNVLEVEMLEKLNLDVTEQPVGEEKNVEEEEPKQQPEEAEEEKEQLKVVEEIAEVPEVPEAPAVDDSNDDDRKINEDDKPEEQATDVSTVDAFKTKEIDVKSIETEKIDVPEEDTPDTVSTDE